jgi:hypothetical protein
MNGHFRSILFGLALVTTPTATVILAGPIAEVPWQNPGGPTLWQLSIALPVYVGLLCAPGFVYAAFVRPRAAELSLSRQWWIRISLVFASLAALGGVVGGMGMIFLAPPSLISMFSSLYLLWEFERGRIRSLEQFRTRSLKGPRRL